MRKARSLILFGGGGHGRVVAAMARALGLRIAMLIDPDGATRVWHDGEICIDEEAVLASSDGSVGFLNGLGANPWTEPRRKLFDRIVDRLLPTTLVHPSAIIDADVYLGRGVQVMAGAIVQPGAQLGDNCVINTGSRLDHDCRIGAHAFISPGATLCGDVKIGENAFIGAASVIAPGLEIGRAAIVGAGAAVIRSIPEGRIVAGNPAQNIDE